MSQLWMIPLAIVAARSPAGFPGAVSAHPLDRWMLLGFMSAVMLLASFTIGRQSIPQFTMRFVSVAALAAYGFEAGAWPIAMVLSLFWAKDLCELIRPLAVKSKSLRRLLKRRRVMKYRIESRITRMFDIDPAANWEHENRGDEALN